MSLEDRLEAYLEVVKMSRAVEGHHYKVDEDAIVVLIKNAFEEEGWVNDIARKHFNDAYIDGIKQEAGLMTGKEWYEKFEKELEENTLRTSHGCYLPPQPDYENTFFEIDDVKNAAKRASGVEDD